jgi:hypothetical protein
MNAGLGWPQCVCNIGAQRCGVHPEHRQRTKEEYFEFRRAWDERVERGMQDD